MASALEIRRRIRSVHNTRQITRAMQLVAASRMRRAQEAVRAARPYADCITAMLQRLSEVSDPEQLPPLLRPRPIEKTAYVVMTTNRGLCGALNSNTARLAADRLSVARSYAEVSLIIVGKKGHAALRGLAQLKASFVDIADRPSIEDIAPVGRLLVEDFEQGTYDEVQLVYPRFVNTLMQEATAIRLLPVAVPEAAAARSVRVQFLYEPDPVTVLGAMIPRFIETVLYRVMLELAASEQSARMVAMRNATDNATEVIRTLQLAYNKERQAGITREILDIAAGANALAEA
ncbi:MAG: ATP synthase F1 subunit gamma [Actinobacteria bacterium]|nr:ATP synthase F1 subunit gamma [Actinomycetota bacterium]